ncbi:MAG: ABC transporter permease [Gaiellaceae bacterium]
MTGVKPTIVTDSEMIQHASAPTVAMPTSDDVTRIVARKHAGWTAYIREALRYRDLLFFLVLRDIRVRYSQTVLGFGWSVLQPFLQMIVFSVFFGALAGVSSGNVPYPVFSLAAVVPWTYFSNAVGTSASSLITNAQLVSKVYFPRVFVPLAPIGAGLVDLAISFVLLAGVMAFYGIVPPWWGFLVLPLLIVMLVLCTTGFSLWLSALGARYRDVRYVTPFILQLLLFVTPIIYVLSSVPPSLRPFYALNPLVGVVSGFRAALLDQGPLPVTAMLTSIVVSAMLVVTGLIYFRRVERALADIA